MPKKSSTKFQSKSPQERHRFFLNPYDDCAFTKCPKCETKTRVRKFAFLIHIEPQQILVLNKQCKYCTNCDLIIAKKQEIESLMAFSFSQSNPNIIGNKYVVMGTIDRKDWKEGNQNSLSSSEILKRVYLFKDVWNFEVIPAGWYPTQEE